MTDSAEDREARLRRWIDNFPWVVAESTPWTPFQKDLKNSRLAVITTGGIHLKTETPFDAPNPDGDWSFRVIPKNTPVSDLAISHDHYNTSYAKEDLNCVFPLERYREMEASGEIGQLAEINYSFMGYIPKPEGLIKDTAPAIARRLKEADVDAVFLSPA